MENRDAEYLIMYIIFEEYYLYESRNDEVSILFGGMLPILSDRKMESMVPSYLSDWKEEYKGDSKTIFCKRVEKYLRNYSNKINNPKDIMNLINFIQQQNFSIEEKYESLRIQTIENLYKIVQSLASKF